MTQTPPPESYPPPPAAWQHASAYGQLEPHRGTLILVLGILGLVVCFICGIVAWSLGNGDLAKMAAGRMDPSGRDMTQAGRICGMISVILALVGLGIGILYMIIVFAVLIPNAR